MNNYYMLYKCPCQSVPGVRLGDSGPEWRAKDGRGVWNMGREGACDLRSTPIHSLPVSHSLTALAQLLSFPLAIHHAVP